MAQKHLGLKPVACAMLFGGNVHAGALQWKLVCINSYVNVQHRSRYLFQSTSTAASSLDNPMWQVEDSLFVSSNSFKTHSWCSFIPL